MQLQAQVYGTNTLKQHVVLSSDPTGKQFIEWFANGDPSGNDVQVVPEAVLNTAQFQKLLNRGIIVVTDDFNAPEVVAAMNGQRQAWEARGALASASAQSTILREADNDLISVGCCGPDTRGVDNKCGTPVPIRITEIGTRPPLCTLHAGMKHQYIAVEEGDDPTSKVVVYRRMATTTAVREIAVG